MNVLTRETLKRLSIKYKGKCVSIYLPTEKSGKEIAQGRIRLKNLLKQAGQDLGDTGMSTAQAELFLKPADTLLEDVRFWNYQEEGLALFITPEGMDYFRLPIPCEETVIVSNRLYIIPLLKFLREDKRFYVLALSQNNVRLLDCTRYSVEEIKLDGIPNNLEEALYYDHAEKQLQFHSGTGKVGNNGRPPIYHGHGVGTDDHKNNILRFLQQLANGLGQYIESKEIPVILAGVDYIQSMYREVDSVHHVWDKGIIGNQERLKDEQLRDLGWNIIKPHVTTTGQTILERYNEKTLLGQVYTDVHDIASASYYGRVEMLIVTSDVQTWGVFNEEKNRIDLYEKSKPEVEDIVNFAAMNTFFTGGDVIVLDQDQIPDNVPYLALLRY